MGNIKKHTISEQKSKYIKESKPLDSIPPECKKPVFSFQYLDKEYCISLCEKEDKIALVDQLRILSSLTWAEIRQNGRHATGSEKIKRNSIKRPVPIHIKEDATFIALRFSGKKSMVGYRENEIFHVIWLDRNFTLYNHG